MRVIDEWKEEFELMNDDYTFKRPGCRLMHTILLWMMVIWCDVNGRSPLINCWNGVFDAMYKAVVDILSLLDDIVVFGHRVVLNEEGQKFVDGFMRAFTDGIYAAASMGLFSDNEED